MPEPSIFFNEDLEDCDDAPEEASLLYFVTGGGDTASAKASFPGSGGSHQVFYVSLPPNACANCMTKET